MHGADCNKQPHGNAHGLLMPTAEVVSIARLQIPAKSSLRPRPKYEIERSFPCDGIGALTAADGVRPFRANAEHELRRLGVRIGVLEEKVGVPVRLWSCAGRRRKAEVIRKVGSASRSFTDGWFCRPSE